MSHLADFPFLADFLYLHSFFHYQSSPFANFLAYISQMISIVCLINISFKFSLITLIGNKKLLKIYVCLQLKLVTTRSDLYSAFLSCPHKVFKTILYTLHTLFCVLSNWQVTMIKRTGPYTDMTSRGYMGLGVQQKVIHIPSDDKAPSQ